MKKNRINKLREFFSGTRVIMFGFLAAVLLGAVLLACPFAQKEKVSFVDALFVSASSVCVTGLSTVNIGQVFSTAGHIIIMLLIQVGGLGFVTFATLIMMLLGKRLTLRNKLLIQNAYNVTTMSGLGKMTRNIIFVSLAIEAAGACGYAFYFIPAYGLKGIWYSVFHSVSAFCNAGIDLLGGNSFTALSENVIINTVTVLLIIVSGLGFPVYWEINELVRNRYNRVNGRKPSVHLKLVFTVTAILIVSGALFTFIFEYSNPESLGGMSLWNKIQASVFQSVTLRTAGFATIDQSAFTNASCGIYLLYMFIGGSPAGTAGGVKTVTFAVMAASVASNIKGRKDVCIFGRKISDDVVKQCTTIITFSFSVLFTGTVLIFATQDCDFLDALYEMTSAIATVGLSRGLTGSLNTIGKLIVTATMYLGRVGPISLALFFRGKTSKEHETRIETNLLIG